MKHIKVLITGGHLTPALAVIEALPVNSKVLFVGRQQVDQHQTLSREPELISKTSATFIPFEAAKLHRKPFTRNLTQAPLFFTSFQKARKLLKTHKPDVFLSFGGYLAVPFALAAKSLGIPIVTHEQTTTLGLTNRLLGHISTHLAYSWPTDLTQERLPQNATLTGNPVRSQFLKPGPKPKWIDTHRPILLVTGGSQGALDLNRAIESHFDFLTSRYYLVHQVGNFRKSKLSHQPSANYYPVEFLDAQSIAYLMHHARLVIARSGANTITELLLTATPSILVPLPFSAGNEQTKNALLLQHLGLAHHLPETKLHQLPQTINTFTPQSLHPDRRVKQLAQLHSQAAQQLVNLLLQCVSNSTA